MDIIRPAHLQDALRLLAEGQRPAAGCTNIFVDRRKKGESDDRYVDISTLSELQGICESGGKTELGALTTFSRLEEYFQDKAGFRALYDAAAQMGNPQVRNRATLGGNLADASPACDAGPVLLALNASVRIVSAQGERVIPVEDFFLGVRHTVLKPGELIRSVLLPKTPERTAWRKVRLRNASAVSVLSLAACHFADGRVFLSAGAAAPRPVRLYHCEAALQSGNLRREALITALNADIDPIDDIRAAADYRRKTAANLLLDLLGKEFGYEIG